MAAGYGGRGNMMVAPQGAPPAGPQPMSVQPGGNWYQQPWWQQGNPANTQYQSLFSPQGGMHQGGMGAGNPQPQMVPQPLNAGLQTGLPQPLGTHQTPQNGGGMRLQMLSRALA